MKKNVWMAGFAVLLVAARSALAAEVTVHPDTKYGATHVVTVKASDFTTTATNTAETLTWAVGANEAYRMIGMRLVKAFDNPARTNDTLSVIVGDAGDDDRYLAATELALDGTEVWAKFGRTAFNSGTATNVTFAYGENLFTSAGDIRFKFTPNTNNATTSFTTGEVKFWFQKF